MKHSLLFTFSLFLFSFFLSAAETVSIPVLADRPSLVDGMLTDECWAKAFKVGRFLPIRPDQPPVAERSEALLFATKEHLYLGLVGYTKDAKALNRQAADAKLSLWAADHFEVFLDPGDSGNLWQFAFAVTGAAAGDKQNRCRYGVQLYDDRYQIEVEIPLDVVPLKEAAFRPGWRLNLCRATKDMEYTSWAKLSSGTFHEAESFNRIAGIDYDLNALLARQLAAVKPPLEVKGEHRLCVDPIARFVVEASEKTVGNSLSLTVTNVTGAVLWKRDVPRTGAKTAVAVSIAGWTEGRYRLEASLANVKAPGVDFWKIAQKRSQPKIDYTCRNLAIYRNGEFFFPLVVWGGAPDWETFKNHRFDTNAFFRCYHRRLEDQRALGFNAVIADGNYYPDLARTALTNALCRPLFAAWHPYQRIAQLPFDFTDVCRLHAEHGLAMIPYLHIWHPERIDELEPWLGAVLRWREADNILCWHLSDEMDGGITHNRILNEIHHEMDPKRLTWVNCIQGIVANRDNADILSTDPYPIPHGSVTTVGYHAKRLLETCRPDQSPWLWVQMFGGEGNWTRSPTMAELTAMVFIALNRGIRGICYFNYTPSVVRRDGVSSLTVEDYAKLGPHNRRVERLAKTFCLGEAIVRTFDEKTLVDGAVVRQGKDVLVSVVNGSPKPQRVRFVLPAGVPSAGVATVDDENRNVRYSDGAIEEDFEPFAVRLYWIKP